MFEFTRRALVVGSITIGMVHPAMAQSQQWILPIVVDGAVNPSLYFQTTVRLLNVSGVRAQWNIQAFDNSGQGRPSLICSDLGPLDLEPPPQILSPGALMSKNSVVRDLLTDGWATVTYFLPATLEASAEIRLVAAPPQSCPDLNRRSTEIVSYVLIPPVRPAKEFHLAASIRKGRRQTAFAIVNPSDTVTANVTMTILQASGELAARSFTLPLAPRHRFAKFVIELFPDCRNSIMVNCFDPLPPRTYRAR